MDAARTFLVGSMQKIRESLPLCVCLRMKSLYIDTSVVHAIDPNLSADDHMQDCGCLFKGVHHTTIKIENFCIREINQILN